MWGEANDTANLCIGVNPSVSPQNFKAALEKHFKRYADGNQHDSHELATHLLDALHEDTRVFENPYAETALHGDTKSASRVHECFMGQVKSTIKCPHCGPMEPKIDDVMIMSVPIPGLRVGKPYLSILDCIDKYTEGEQLILTCDCCSRRVHAWKHIQLYRSPPILVIHLKRFESSDPDHPSKIETFVNFPLEGLDLSERFSNKSEQKRPIYDCYAISNHMGEFNSGHYTAFALNNDGIWCKYDDDKDIRTITNPMDVITSSAYMLYYRRRDVVVAEPRW